MSKDYTHEDMQYLEDIEHIRIRPGMYIGMTEHPNHLLYELLDNSLDEAKAGHATTIAIIIDSTTKEASVADNGRGIPFKDDTVIKISTKLFSGGKFKKNEQTAYSIASGLHGVGIVAVNALSEFLHFTIYRDGEKATINFKNAEVALQEVEKNDGNRRPFSTKASFKPDKQYFDSVKFDLDAIRERLRVASVHIPNLTLVLFVDGKKEIIKCSMEDYFNSVLLNGAKMEDVTSRLDTTSKVKDESVTLTFNWELNVAAAHRANGCVNMLSVNQGSHINGSLEVIRNVFERLAKEKKISKFNKYDSMIGLRCYTSIMLYEPEYSSQTKERLTVSKNDMKHLYDRLEEKLYELLTKKSDFVDSMFDYWKVYKNKKESKGTIVKSSSKNVTRYNQSIDSKLRDCTTHNVSESELFIVEGTSAGGCWSAETKILLDDGKVDTIENIVHRINLGEKLKVLSIDDSLNIVPSDILSAICTKFVDEVIEFEFDDGEIYSCTPDHLIRLKDGSYKEAGKLTENDDIIW